MIETALSTNSTGLRYDAVVRYFERYCYLSSLLFFPIILQSTPYSRIYVSGFLRMQLSAMRLVSAVHTL